MTAKIVKDTQCMITGEHVLQGETIERAQMVGKFCVGMVQGTVMRFPARDCAMVVERVGGIVGKAYAKKRESLEK